MMQQERTNFSGQMRIRKTPDTTKQDDRNEQ